ncbi:hypothetical protein BD779DRAFT_1534958 [Infundibulicybe gibba]|nr:hypothetical protein BD779DRAFT_1534958 [Infundibulicybe gibba]
MPPAMATIAEKIQATRQSLLRKPPYCTGVCPLVVDTGGVLFYRHGETSRWLDLSQASNEQLEQLTSACEPATFGLNQENVLDESYRKAWKMDTKQFATKFDLKTHHLLERIRVQLMEGLNQERGIHAELYKLNVYGPGSFFKPHKDTPRGSDMFGSLVVVFPTRHDGGVFRLRHQDEEWSFDSAVAVSGQDEPAFGYIAFFSDVEHEVSVVTSGHRVTLTFNLYFDSKEAPALPKSIVPVAPDDTVFKDALANLLRDPEFLSMGGLLGFGLRFMYPVSTAVKRLERLMNSLKGCDSVVQHVCEELSLRVSLNSIYKVRAPRGGSVRVAIEEVVPLGSLEPDSDNLLDLFIAEGGTIIYEAGTNCPLNWRREPFDESMEIVWITELTKLTRCRTDYMAYGNEASSEHIYCDICLIAEVPSARRRGALVSDEGSSPMDWDGDGDGDGDEEGGDVDEQKANI